MTSPPNNRKELEEIVYRMGRYWQHADNGYSPEEATQAIEHLVLEADLKKVEEQT